MRVPPAAGRREERAGQAGGRSSPAAGRVLLHGTGGRPGRGGVEEGRPGGEDSRRRGSRVGAL